MKPSPLVRAAVFAPLMAAALVAGRAEDSLPVATRKVFEQNKDSVIWISAVAKMSFGTSDSKAPMNIPDQERKFEAVGTIIDAGGLVVAALSTLDPTREITGREINTPSGKVRLDATATLKEVKLILPDGTEVPADVVMKDLDLDLAFLKPKADSKEARGATFKPVDLKKSAVGGIADDTVTVMRMDEMLNRQPAVQGGQVVAITQKPRAFLRVSGTGAGCPTFAMDGRVLGISVNRFSRERPPITVVLPAADVLEIAEQAKAAKPLSVNEPAPPEARPDAKKAAAPK